MLLPHTPVSRTDTNCVQCTAEEDQRNEDRQLQAMATKLECVLQEKNDLIASLMNEWKDKQSSHKDERQKEIDSLQKTIAMAEEQKAQSLETMIMTEEQELRDKEIEKEMEVEFLLVEKGERERGINCLCFRNKGVVCLYDVGWRV